MKNILTVLSVSCAVLFGACEAEGVEKPVAASTYEEKLDTITPYLRPDLELSAERPRPDVMSEQEIAVRAFTYLWNDGMLSSTSYLLQEDPRLPAAKVQKPILCYNLSEDYGETFYIPGGVTNYEAIDTHGMAGSPDLYGRRMARIDGPAANFFEKIKAASSTYAIPNSPKPVFEFTPLE
jgi:hypothetical protein